MCLYLHAGIFQELVVLNRMPESANSRPPDYYGHAKRTVVQPLYLSGTTYDTQLCHLATIRAVSFLTLGNSHYGSRCSKNGPSQILGFLNGIA